MLSPSYQTFLIPTSLHFGTSGHIAPLPILRRRHYSSYLGPSLFSWHDRHRNPCTQRTHYFFPCVLTGLQSITTPGHLSYPMSPYSHFLFMAPRSTNMVLIVRRWTTCSHSSTTPAYTHWRLFLILFAPLQMQRPEWRQTTYSSSYDPFFSLVRFTSALHPSLATLSTHSLRRLGASC